MTLGLLMTFAPSHAAPAAGRGEQRPEPDRVAWRALRFHAAKLFLSATADISLDLLAADDAGARLSAVPDGTGRAPVGDRVARITVVSKVVGRETIEKVWIDPFDGGALERRKEQLGGKPYQRTDRYTAAGIHRERRAPKNAKQADKPADRWSDRETSFLALPRGAGQAPVSHALALFYLVSALPLEHPGDRYETAIVAKGQRVPVLLEVVGSEVIKVAFEERAGDEVSAREGKVEALRIRISSTGARNDDVRLLGVKRDIEMLIEPGSRLPLVVRGSVSIVGRVDVKLTHVERR